MEEREVLPVCKFICGEPQDEDIFNQVCQTTCELRANCALTPNVLYTFVNAIVNNANFFVAGVGDILRNRLGGLNFRIALYQQIPWMFGFIVILGILVTTNVIYISTALIFLVIAILVAALVIYIIVSDTQSTVNETVKEVERKLASDYKKARDELAKDLDRPLSQALQESQVPCGCKCPVLNNGNSS